MHPTRPFFQNSRSSPTDRPTDRTNTQLSLTECVHIMLLFHDADTDILARKSVSASWNAGFKPVTPYVRRGLAVTVWKETFHCLQLPTAIDLHDMNAFGQKLDYIQCRNKTIGGWHLSTTIATTAARIYAPSTFYPWPTRAYPPLHAAVRNSYSRKKSISDRKQYTK